MKKVTKGNKVVKAFYALRGLDASNLNMFEVKASYKKMVIDKENTKASYNCRMKELNRLHCKGLDDLGNGVWVKFLCDKYANKFYTAYESSLCNRWSSSREDMQQQTALKFMQYCNNLKQKMLEAKTEKDLEKAVNKLIQGVDNIHWVIRGIAKTECYRAAKKALSQVETVLDDSILFNKVSVPDMVNNSLLEQDLISHIKLNGSNKEGRNPALALLFHRLQGSTKSDFEKSTGFNYSRTKKSLETLYTQWFEGENMAI